MRRSPLPNRMLCSSGSRAPHAQRKDHGRAAQTIRPQPAQARWYRFWEESGYFNDDPNPDKKPYTIVIPPPNVTGACTWATP